MPGPRGGELLALPLCREKEIVMGLTNLAPYVTCSAFSRRGTQSGAVGLVQQTTPAEGTPHRDAGLGPPRPPLIQSLVARNTPRVKLLGAAGASRGERQAAGFTPNTLRTYSEPNTGRGVERLRKGMT